MTHLFNRTFKLAVALTFLMLQPLLPSHAEALSSQDEKALQTVVQSQLAAFAKDDADKAFSYAAPELRKSIGSSSAFMAMVKSSYPVVYRPASVVFLKPESTDTGAKSGAEVIQRVQMLDASGASWLAVYSLQRQKDKSWRIASCVLLENKGRVT